MGAICAVNARVTAQITPPPTDLYPGIFWIIPGYDLEYTLGYSLGAPRLYPRVGLFILGAPRGYPTCPDYSPSDSRWGIFWEIFYIITINDKFKIEKFSHTIIKKCTN